VINQQEKELIALFRRTDKSLVTSRDLVQFHELVERQRQARLKAQSMRLGAFIAFVPPIVGTVLAMAITLGQPVQWVIPAAIWGGVGGLAVSALCIHFVLNIRELRAF
jgi:hypothetical protein